MNGPNPYEAPRFVAPLRPSPRRKPSGRAGAAGCLFALSGAVVGASLGATVLHPSTAAGGAVAAWFGGLTAEDLTCLSGFLGAVTAAVFGHVIIHSLSEPPSLPDLIEEEARAKRKEILDRIAVAEHLLAQAVKDGDVEDGRKLAAYKLRLEQELGP